MVLQITENKGDRKGHSVIDLFAGCGGLSLGLYQAGWEGQFLKLAAKRSKI